jgi:hypothetical protein
MTSERAVIEAQRRVALLPSEVKDWLGAADANLGGLGIHRSQLLALGDLMEELTRRQRDLLDNRPSSAATRESAAAELDMSAEIVGAWELWGAFRSTFEQRRDARLVRRLDAADLVAANGYRTCLDQAAVWGLVHDGEFREPPLVCGEAVNGPLTAARGTEAAGLSSTITRFKKQRLPIPLILFPADRLDSLWTFATVMHEVGHDLDADLAFANEAVELTDQTLAMAGVTDTRRTAWRRWGKENVADAMGVVLGGAGFASSLAAWLLPIAPAADFSHPSDDLHAPPHLRVRLLAGFLRATVVPAWTVLADDLTAASDAANPHDWQKPFWGETDAIALTMLTKQLATLAGHSLLELVDDIAADAAMTDRLATYLRTGYHRDPPPAGPPVFPFRLVPSAAELAVRTSVDRPDFDGIDRRGLDYLHAIPRPAFLDASPGRRTFLRGLGSQLDVRAARRPTNP